MEKQNYVESGLKGRRREERSSDIKTTIFFLTEARAIT